MRDRIVMREIFYRWNRSTLDNASGASQQGGIDLDPSMLDMAATNAGESFKFNLDPVMLRQMQEASGVTPVIEGISQLESLSVFMGVPEGAGR